MSNTSNPIFSPSCPNGGDYYACGNGAKFVGCCASDPCNDAGCSAGNLRTMSFDPAYWGTPQMPDQQCSVAGQQWWSCSATDPPFLGCCSVNPCTSGCPQANLIQGTLSNVASVANAFDPQPPLSSTNDTNTDNGSSVSSSSGVSTGVIVGAVVGGVAVLVIALALFWWLRRRSHKRARATSASHPMVGGYMGNQGEKNNYYQDTPPMPSYSQQGTPLPAYGFQNQQHQPFVHEADPANQIHPGYTSPGSPPSHQRYSSTMSGYSNSPSNVPMSPHRTYQQPPSELSDSSTPLRGLGVQHLSPINQHPAELGDSERGTDDGRDDSSRSARSYGSGR